MLEYANEIHASHGMDVYYVIDSILFGQELDEEGIVLFERVDGATANIFCN
jgi:hypothetical protein